MGATESCNGIDENCDGNEDQDLTTTYYRDADADGWGGDESSDACSAPTGYVEQTGDCDDNDAQYHPGAEELCTDTVDFNCDGSVGYMDADGDSWAACEDCDDSDGAVHPGATEVCDGVDNNCNGRADDEDGELDVATATRFYTDADSDGFGDISRPALFCEAPVGYVNDSSDCDDTSAAINPTAVEVCNSLDDDCDTLIDDADSSRAGGGAWFRDDDGDGYGDPAVSTVSCQNGAGYVADNTDCDDSNGAIRPNGLEVCDGIDNNCNALVDDADPSVVGQLTWYADTDGDGFGDAAAATVACTQPAGSISDATDCDDSRAAVFPGATEVCNSLDDDCDTRIDDADAGLSGAPSWYDDQDGDGFGDPNAATQSCIQPAQTVSDATDCDDGDVSTYPLAPEVCDGTDNDCDGHLDDTDPDVVGQSAWYQDQDGDGFGNAAVYSLSCSAPTGYVASDDDCDDTRTTVSPAGVEVCGGLDDDCDGLVDDADPSMVGAPAWYADSDGDLYGAAGNLSYACLQPSGYVGNASDCDDTAASTNPGAAERCDAVDNDCDGLIDGADPSVTGQAVWYADADRDGYGNSGSSTQACSAPSGYVANATDCNDSAAAINPAATEVCDSVDNDCDGLTDDADAGVSGQRTWYRDTDADGYGGSTTVLACTAPAGTVATSTDCNDSAAAINPAATEVCDSVDNDCDALIDDADPGVTGRSTWYADSDGDGFGGSSSSTTACTQPSGYRSTNTDCNDSSAFTFPGAAPNNSTTACMTDVDGDDYGATNPAAGATAGSDCNDANASTQACASTHIGYDVDLGGRSSHSANYLLGSRYTVPTSFTVTALAVIGRTAGPNMKLALYSDSGGSPANLIVQTATTALAVGAQEVAVTPTVIPAGDYWFMGIYQSSASIGISFSNTDTVKYRSLSFSTALPASFGAPSTYTGQRFNYYIVGY